MSNSSSPKLKSGARLAHYEIEDAIGEGAMGVVYRAHDTALDRPVAVKVLKHRVTEDEALVTRFFREARAAAKVNHPHLTHIYFVGEDDGAHFFAMELLPGQDLYDHVKAYGPMSWGKALEILVQTARGLSAAHAAGVIHRDVKPSNIILLPDGQAKVTDFGLAKSLDADVAMTQDGTLMGTPTYMSPEQCRGRPVDARTDIYALGLTAWYLLTGKPPYAGGNLGEMLDRQMNEPLPPARSERPELPAELDEVLAKMCAKDPDKRPQDMEQVARMLTECLPGALHPAGLFARGVALAIDGIVTGLAVAMTWIALSMISDGTFHFDVSEQSRHGPLVLGVWWALSQLGCEWWWGQTVGKWLMQLRVVDERGRRPTFRALLLRYVVRFPAAPVWIVGGALGLGEISSYFGMFGYLAVGVAVVVWLWTSYRAPPARTLSDVLTRTRVAYVIASERTRS